MKKFYLHNGTQSIGPFDKEELRQRGVVKTTPIWVEGCERWTCAENYEDLQDLFYTIPPAQLLNSLEITRLKKKNKYLKWALLISVGLLLASLVIIVKDEIQTKKIEIMSPPN
jgi:hypothetical protein